LIADHWRCEELSQEEVSQEIFQDHTMNQWNNLEFSGKKVGFSKFNGIKGIVVHCWSASGIRIDKGR
jgi:hypothetical protein